MHIHILYVGCCLKMFIQFKFGVLPQIQINHISSFTFSGHRKHFHSSVEWNSKLLNSCQSTEQRSAPYGLCISTWFIMALKPQGQQPRMHLSAVLWWGMNCSSFNTKIPVPAGSVCTVPSLPPAPMSTEMQTPNSQQAYHGQLLAVNKTDTLGTLTNWYICYMTDSFSGTILSHTASKTMRSWKYSPFWQIVVSNLNQKVMVWI